jgi:hypothetical protein
MKPKLLPLQLLPYTYPGTHRDWWRKRANSGELGPISVEPGRVRNRTVETAEVESRFGAISANQYAEAVRQYKAARRVVRRPL